MRIRKISCEKKVGSYGRVKLKSFMKGLWVPTNIVQADRGDTGSVVGQLALYH